MLKAASLGNSKDDEVGITGCGTGQTGPSAKPEGLQPEMEEDIPMLVKTQPLQKTLRDELLETIGGSNMDTVKATLALWNHYVEETFDPMEYQKFLDDVKYLQIAYFDAGAPLFHPDIYEHPQAVMMIDIRNMIKHDVTLSLSTIVSPVFEKSPRKRARVRSQVSQLKSIDNLTFEKTRLDDTHVIPEDDIFRGLNLRDFLFSTWKEKPNVGAYDNLHKSTKHILAHICKMPEDITQFTHTLFATNSRKFRKLPDHILSVLRGMMAQLTGFDDPFYHVYDGEQAKQQFPERWAALGSDDNARSQELKFMLLLKEQFTDTQNKIIIDSLTELRRCDFSEVSANGTCTPTRKRTNR